MNDLADAPTAQLIRPLTASDIRCPAGSVVGDAGCYCRIERGVIDGRKDPTSIEAFCLGKYDGCSTWRAEKHRIAANDKTELVDRDADVRALTRKRKNDAVERRERAKELMLSNTEEGRRFRAQVASIIDGRGPVAARR